VAIKLGFDAKRAFNNHSGLGVYSRDLINYILKFSNELELILYSPKAKIQFLDKTQNSKFKIQNSKLNSLWRSFLIYFDIKKEKLDIYHGLAGEIPFWLPKSTKKLVTIHDLLFLRFPSDYGWIDRNIYSIKSKYACIQSDKIIAVSQSTKNDIAEYYSISPDKIEVIPVGLNIKVKECNRLYTRDYIVCISSFIPRKNQMLLIEAFNLIADKIDCDLVLIGSGSYWNEVNGFAKKSKHRNRIIFIKKATDDEKFTYLSQAKFSVYPSKYEGFGIPIIESMAYQVPIIVSDTAIHREVAGDAAIYFENNSKEDLVNKLILTYNLSSSEKNKLIEKGLARVEKFNIENVYPRLIEIYQSL
jgi:glycosyltransferase involved in cell wall biosynthesis